MANVFLELKNPHEFNRSISTAGVVGCAGLLTLISMGSAWYIWHTFPPPVPHAGLGATGTAPYRLEMPDGLIWWFCGGMLGAFISGGRIVQNHNAARNWAWVYAASQGIALAGGSIAAEQFFPGIAAELVGLSFEIFGLTIVLYLFGVIRTYDKLRAFVTALLLSLVALYFVRYVMQQQGFDVPGVNMTSPEGALVSLSIAAVTILALVADFEEIERISRTGVSPETAWYAAFGLTFTLVWMYIEAPRYLLQGRRLD